MNDGQVHLGGAPPAGEPGAPQAGAPPVHPVPPAAPQPNPPVPGQAPPLPQAPVQINNYGDYYRFAANDPHHGDYAEVAADFRAALQGNSKHSPNTLGDRVVAASTAHIPYPMLACYKKPNVANDPGTLHVVHRITKIPLTVVGEPESWDDTNVGIVDDIVHGQYHLAPFPATNFALSPVGGITAVPTAEALLQHIQAHPDTVHPHVADGDPNTDNIRTRLATHIPFDYVPIFLGRALSPLQGYAELHGAATAANQLADLQPLLDFLRLSATAADENSPLGTTAQDWPTLPTPPSARLLGLFSDLLDHDLPGRKAPSSTAPAPTSSVAPLISAIGDLTAEQRPTRLDAEARHSRTSNGNTPQQLWGTHGVLKLLRLTHVHAEGQLPPLWGELAKAPKAGRLAVVQNRFDAERLALGVHTPVQATVSMVSKLVNLSSLFPPDQDQLTHGINPFLFGLTTPSQADQLLQRAHLYRTLYSSGGAPSLTDVVTLEADDDIRVATDVAHLGPSLDGCRVALSAVLGQNHLVVASLNHLRADVGRHMQSLAHRQYSNPTLAAEIQRYVQVVLRQWFMAQADSDTPLPSLIEHHAISHAAMGRVGWGYELPSDIKPTPAPASGLPGSPPGMVPPTAPPPRQGPASEAPGRRREPGSNQIVRKPNGVSSLFADVAARPGVRSRDVRLRCQNANIAFPLNASGGVRCLPYHLRGQCNTNCANAADHRADHSPDEEQQLLAWAQTHWTTE